MSPPFAKTSPGRCLAWLEISRLVGCRGEELFLEKLHLTGHVRGVEPFPDENQAAGDVADASLPLLAIDDAGVLDPRGCQAKEVIILAEDDSALGKTIRELVLVDGSEEAHLGCGRHIDATAAEAGGDGMRAVLIKMESNRPWHGASVP